MTTRTRPRRPTTGNITVRAERRILRALMADADRLTTLMRRDLVWAFRRLGDRAETAAQPFLEELVSEWAKSAYIKEGMVDDGIVGAISRSMGIDDWDGSDLKKVYGTGRLRTMNFTVNTLNSQMGLGVSLPDHIQRNILSEGGIRRGLVDIRGQTRKALFRSLREGRERGLGVNALAGNIRDSITRGRFRSVETRAYVIAKTETRYAQNQSALATYGRMDVVTGVRAWDAQAGATDAECEQRDGLVFSIADAEIETGHEHPLGTLAWTPYNERRGATPPPAPTAPPAAPPYQSLARRGFPEDQVRISQADWDTLADDFAHLADSELDQAIYSYQHTGFENMNRFLRGQALEREPFISPEELIEYYRTASQKIVTVARTHVDELGERAVFRGDIWDEVKRGKFDLKAGDTVDMTGFTSTSGNLDTAAEFAAKLREGAYVDLPHYGIQRRITWEFRNPGDARGIILRDGGLKERELFMVPGTRARVLDVIEDAKLPFYGDELAVNRHIVVEIVDEAAAAADDVVVRLVDDVADDVTAAVARTADDVADDVTSVVAQTTDEAAARANLLEEELREFDRDLLAIQNDIDEAVRAGQQPNHLTKIRDSMQSQRQKVQDELQAARGS